MVRAIDKISEGITSQKKRVENATAHMELLSDSDWVYAHVRRLAPDTKKSDVFQHAYLVPHANQIRFNDAIATACLGKIHAVRKIILAETFLASAASTKQDSKSNGPDGSFPVLEALTASWDAIRHRQNAHEKPEPVTLKKYADALEDAYDIGKIFEPKALKKRGAAGRVKALLAHYQERYLDLTIQESDQFLNNVESRIAQSATIRIALANGVARGRDWGEKTIQENMRNAGVMLDHVQRTHTALMPLLENIDGTEAKNTRASVPLSTLPIFTP